MTESKVVVTYVECRNRAEGMGLTLTASGQYFRLLIAGQEEALIATKELDKIETYLAGFEAGSDHKGNS